MTETKGTLYLVPTPIGNLEDMTYRAVRVLQEVHTIAAEDTRHSGLLLKHFDIKKPLISYHEHNKDAKEEPLMELLLSGHDVAVISDAGMPAISDPGADLVLAAIDAGNSCGTVTRAECGLDGTHCVGARYEGIYFFRLFTKEKQSPQRIVGARGYI